MRYRAHFPTRWVQDAAGNVLNNAVVRVYKGNRDALVQTTQTLWKNRVGTSDADKLAQGYTADTGKIEFWLDRPGNYTVGYTVPGGTETLINDIVAQTLASPFVSVKEFGAVGDGVTDDTAAIQDALDHLGIDFMSLFFPDGTYLVSAELFYPQVDGVTIWGVPGANARRSPATIKVKNLGTPLTGILVSREWFLNQPDSGGAHDGQGLVLMGITLDGGGVGPQFVPVTWETTSNAQYGLILHGSNHKVIDVFVNSCNLDGMYIAGNVGKDTHTAINETHELWIRGGGIRNCGRDGLHIAGGAKDNSFIDIKIQYCGRWAFYTESNTAAQQLTRIHPSRCGSGFICFNGAWDSNIDHCYLDSLANWLTGIATPYRGANDPVYAIWVETSRTNACHIDHNYGHTDNVNPAQNAAVLLHIKGAVIATYNTLMVKSADVGRDGSGNILWQPKSVEIVGALPVYAANVGNYAWDENEVVY